MSMVTIKIFIAVVNMFVLVTIIIMSSHREGKEEDELIENVINMVLEK